MERKAVKIACERKDDKVGNKTGYKKKERQREREESEKKDRSRSAMRQKQKSCLKFHPISRKSSWFFSISVGNLFRIHFYANSLLTGRKTVQKRFGQNVVFPS